MHRFHRSLFAHRGWLLVLWLTGCGVEAPPRETTTVDSLGVRIVESTAPDPGERWTVDLAPLLSIGEMEGAPHERFTRIQAVATLPDGRVAVLDGGSMELRIHDGEGRFLTRFGGPGDGPGEFRSVVPPLVVRPGGEIGVFDIQLGRLTWIESDGTTLRETVLPEGIGEAARSPVRGALEDGTLVVSAMRSAPPPATGGVMRDTLRLFTATPEGAVLSVSPLVTIPGAVRQILIDGGPDPATIRSIQVMIIPMGGDARALVAGADRIHGGEGDRFEVRTVDREGRLERIARLTESPRPIDAAVRSSFIDHMVAASPNPAARRRFYDGIDFPATMPAYDALLEDPQGNLWVRRYAPAYEERPERWIVLGPEGEWRTEVEMPPGFGLMEVGDTSVLGVHRDDFDVERIRRHPLRR